MLHIRCWNVGCRFRGQWKVHLFQQRRVNVTFWSQWSVTCTTTTICVDDNTVCKQDVNGLRRYLCCGRDSVFVLVVMFWWLRFGGVVLVFVWVFCWEVASHCCWSVGWFWWMVEKEREKTKRKRWVTSLKHHHHRHHHHHHHHQQRYLYLLFIGGNGQQHVIQRRQRLLAQRQHVVQGFRGVFTGCEQRVLAAVVVADSGRKSGNDWWVYLYFMFVHVRWRGSAQSLNSNSIVVTSRVVIGI